MPTQNESNAAVIAEFRSHRGQVASPYPDPPPMVLLHTIGRNSGIERLVPMRCLMLDGAIHVFASAYGQVQNPDWYRNLMAHPEIEIEIGEERLQVRAEDLEGAERARILALHVARFPIFDEYQSRLERQIPVIRLRRTDGALIETPTTTG